MLQRSDQTLAKIGRLDTEASAVSRAAMGVLKQNGDLKLPSMKEPVNALIRQAKEMLPEYPSVCAIGEVAESTISAADVFSITQLIHEIAAEKWGKLQEERDAGRFRTRDHESMF